MKRGIGGVELEADGGNEHDLEKMVQFLDLEVCRPGFVCLEANLHVVCVCVCVCVYVCVYYRQD
jgi:hypothetical protein